MPAKKQASGSAQGYTPQLQLLNKFKGLSTMPNLAINDIYTANMMYNLDIEKDGSLSNRKGFKTILTAPKNICGKTKSWVASDGETYRFFVYGNEGDIPVLAYQNGDTITTVQKYDTFNYAPVTKQTMFNFNIIDNTLFICNYADSISWIKLDELPFKVHSPAPIENPTSAPLLSCSSSLTGTVDNIEFYVKISLLNENGETLLSPQSNSLFIKKPIEFFSGGEYITVQLPTLPAGYNKDKCSIDVWIGIDNIGFCNYKNVKGFGSGESFRLQKSDNVMLPMKAVKTIPAFNSTKHPKCAASVVIDNRIFFYGNADDPSAFYYGGVQPNSVDLTSSNGGGIQYINKNSGEYVKQIIKFRTAQGSYLDTAITDNEYSLGKRFNLTEGISQFDTASLYFYGPEEVDSINGSASNFSAVVSNNTLFYANSNGISYTTTQQEMQNVLVAQYCTLPIKNLWDTIDQDLLYKIQGVQIDNIIYYSMPILRPGLADMSHLLCYDTQQKVFFMYHDNNITYDALDTTTTEAGVVLCVTSGNKLLVQHNEKDDRIGNDIIYPKFFYQSTIMANSLAKNVYQNIQQIELVFQKLTGKIKFTYYTLDEYYGRDIVETKIFDSETVKAFGRDALHHDLVTDWVRIDNNVKHWYYTIESVDDVPTDLQIATITSKGLAQSTAIDIEWGDLEANGNYKGNGSN